MTTDTRTMNARESWNALYSRAKDMQTKGENPAEILAGSTETLAALSLADRQHALTLIELLTDNDKLVNRLERGIKAIQRQAADSSQDTDLPIVIVNGRQPGEVARDAAAALLSKSLLYRHGTRLVQVVRNSDRRPELKNVGWDDIEFLLTQHVFTCELKDRSQRPVPPPPWLSRAVERQLEQDAPQVESITEIPIVHPDGTIHSTPGYDPVSRLIYEPGGLTLDIPNRPDQADARLAAGVIKGLWRTYPFASEASRANHMALLLTGLLRHLFRAVPMCLSDGNAWGVGKTSLGLQVGILQTGRYPSVTTKPETAEEFRKKVTTEVEAGTPLIILDNVTGFLADSALAAVLTTSTWGDRRLGTNQKIDLPCKATWIATGRNLAPRGDIVRRVFWIYLETDDPTHHKKAFDRDMNGYVLEHRPELLTHLFTMIRAWYAAGQPNGKANMGSFEEWARVVGGILAYAGIPGFLGNATELEDEAESDAQEAECFARAIMAHFQDPNDPTQSRPFTAAELSRDIRDTQDERGRHYVYPALREALPGYLAGARSEELSKRLGDYFYFWRRAPLGESEGDRLKIVLMDKKTRENKRLWQIKRIDCIDRIDPNGGTMIHEITPQISYTGEGVVEPMQSMQSMQTVTVVSEAATIHTPPPAPSPVASNGHAAPVSTPAPTPGDAPPNWTPTEAHVKAFYELSHAPAPLTLADWLKASQLPPPSFKRLVDKLVLQRWVAFDGQTYRPAPLSGRILADARTAATPAAA